MAKYLAIIARWINTVLVFMAIIVIRSYKILISPLLGQRCRFHPPCSTYFIESLQTLGFIKGTLKGAKRIVRCNPFGAFGIDDISKK